MKITLIVHGKTEEENIRDGCLLYEQRIKHYILMDLITIPALKNTKALSEEQQKMKEAELTMKYLLPGDKVILLDEKGREFNSVGFADFLQQQMNSGLKNLVFVIGGPYGFAELLYKRANAKISLSKMTFSHQMVRLFFTEQVYRAMTILRNEPYHHQ